VTLDYCTTCQGPVAVLYFVTKFDFDGTDRGSDAVGQLTTIPMYKLKIILMLFMNRIALEYFWADCVCTSPGQ